MEVMVTFNVATDLDLANRVRRHIVNIVLDEREEASDERTHTMPLQHPVHETHTLKLFEG